MSITLDQLIIEVMKAEDGNLESLPPKVKLLLKLLLEEREELLESIRRLEERAEQSEERAKQNSRNSSKPPSQDNPNQSPKPKKAQKTKSRGAQKGHPKSSQSLFETSQCKEVVKHYPKACQCCGESLSPSLITAITRHQYLELPEIELEITEHQVYQLECSHCGTSNTGKLPKYVPQSHYGERLSALIALLRGQYYQSHQKIQDFLKDVLGLSLSTGQINRLSREMSQALEGVVQEAHAYVQQQPVKGSDETSFAQRNGDGNNPEKRGGWLWGMISPRISIFQVSLSRAQSVAQQLLGESGDKIVITDRYGGYNWLPLKNRQICWAHLKRDFTALSERVGGAGEVGMELLKQMKRLFRWWHKWKEGLLSYELLCEAVNHLRSGMRRVLEETASYPLKQGAKSPWAKTVRTCRQILKVEEALWTFVYTSGVEPTNNASERALRPAVIWRRISYGSHSQQGSEFVARMLTAVTSLKQQKCPVFQFLVDALKAHRHGGKAPSLIPST